VLEDDTHLSMVFFIASLVVLLWAVASLSRRRSSGIQTKLGQMSERWLIEHRASHGP